MEKKEDIIEVLAYINEEIEDMLERMNDIENEAMNDETESEAIAVQKKLKEAIPLVSDCIDILESGSNWEEEEDEQ